MHALRMEKQDKTKGSTILSNLYMRSVMKFILRMATGKLQILRPIFYKLIQSLFAFKIRKIEQPENRLPFRYSTQLSIFNGWIYI